jgi:Domain of unknown function (DUF4259)
MAAWDTGPFDNDGAADWAGELDDAEPPARAGLVRAALTEAAEEADYLRVEVAEVAVAAAAVLAASRPGGPAFESAFAPKLLFAEEPLELADDLVPLALRALDRVVADESEWRELWEESGEFDAVLTALAPVREALGG